MWLRTLAVLVVCLLAGCTHPDCCADGTCSPFSGSIGGDPGYGEADWSVEGGQGRPRLLVLTDFGNEPDDAQSLVRLLLYANEIEIEGILATTSMWLRDEVHEAGVLEHVEAYARVRERLLVHAGGFPPAEALRERVHACRPAYGMEGVGPGMDSEGSEHILEVLERDDERHVWVAIWGGANCLAQALWKLEQTRSREDVEHVVSRMRVYSISDQDDAGRCIRGAFPKLSYIVSPSRQTILGKLEDMSRATYPGISGDRSHYSVPGFLFCPLRRRLGWPCPPAFHGPRFESVAEPWLDQHVRSHGPLGARYPRTLVIMEGDTPSFLNLIDNGLAASARPDWGGWGGRYELRRPAQEARAIWTDARDTVVAPDGRIYTSNRATIWRWRDAYQADFAARMDWSIEPLFEGANHNPIAVVNGDATRQPITLEATAGDRVDLSAEGSSDPDGDSLEYAWWAYPEAGGARPTLEIESAGDASLVSTVAPDAEAHLILEVSDGGEPSLRAYRRIIIRVLADEGGGQGGSPSAGSSSRPGPWADSASPTWPEGIQMRIANAAERAGSSALVVVHRGRTVLQWGAIRKRFNSHSIRKGLLGALIGIAVDRGLLDVARPIGSFDLPEGGKLNEVERSATVRDLLMSRSGIYLRAVNETPMAMLSRPRRNAHTPGEHWQYNNWGFNALGVIFEESAGLDIGRAFHEWVAVPIGLEDFRSQDVTYESWPGSGYPAYPFWITARDLASFGWLLAQQGRWGGRQLISKEWIQASTQVHSETDLGGYGLMWWVEDHGRLHAPNVVFPAGAYMAVGFGGQYLVVVPECELVVANLVDTGRSSLERLGWLVLGDSVESEELGAVLLPIMLQAGCDGGPERASQTSGMGPVWWTPQLGE